MNFKFKNLMMIFIFVLGFILMLLVINLEEKQPIKYSYTVQRDSEYTAILLPNEFYDSENLPEDSYYASKSIKSFLINFKYNLLADRDLKVNYRYNIIGNLVGSIDENSDKKIWDKTFILMDDKNSDIENKNNLAINQNVSIDYQNFVDLMNSYEKEYGIKIDTTLKVKLIVYYKIEDDEVIQDCVELDIPVTNSATEVREKYEKEENKIIYSNEKSNPYLVVFLFFLGTLFMIVAVISLILSIRERIRNISKQEKYKRNLKKIYKSYNELIIKISNEPDIKNLKIMKLKAFSDIVDLAEQTRKNIVHYEVEKNKKSILYVIDNDFVYIYEVTDEPL